MREVRENGHYWVKRTGEWITAKFMSNYSLWEIMGAYDEYEDGDFDEIDETRILTPDEQLKSKL